MRNALKQGFPPFLDKTALRSAIESVCAQFGKVAYLDILPAKLRPNLQCACVLVLDSDAAQSALKRVLDVIDFDGKAWFFVDVHEDWIGLRW